MTYLFVALLLAGCAPQRPTRCDCTCGDVYVDIPTAELKALSTRQGIVAPTRRQP